MKKVLVFSVLVLTAPFFGGCCPVSCLIAGSKKPSPAAPADAKPAKPGEKSGK